MRVDIGVRRLPCAKTFHVRSAHGPGHSPEWHPFKRLFFALPVSDAQRRAISQWRRGLNLRSGKPVPSENFHLTLLFLGDVEVAQVPAICAAVDNLARPGAPLRLLLNQLNTWQRANVLVLEPQETPIALRQLVYALQQALLPMGFEEQARDYRPHMTLSWISRPGPGSGRGA